MDSRTYRVMNNLPFYIHCRWIVNKSPCSLFTHIEYWLISMVSSAVLYTILHSIFTSLLQSFFTISVIISITVLIVYGVKRTCNHSVILLLLLRQEINYITTIQLKRFSNISAQPYHCVLTWLLLCSTISALNYWTAVCLATTHCLSESALYWRARVCVGLRFTALAFDMPPYWIKGKSCFVPINVCRPIA